MNVVIPFTVWTCIAEKGYSPRYPPTNAKKPHNAIIHGRDPKATFRREFASWEFIIDRSVVPALLESRDVNKKGTPDDTYFILLPGGEPDLCLRQIINKEDAVWLATQLDAGRNLVDCWDVVTGRRPVGSGDKPTVLDELRQALRITLDYIDSLRGELTSGTWPPPLTDPPFDRTAYEALLRNSVGAL